MQFTTLKRQDDVTSGAICTVLKSNDDFKRLSASEGNLIIKRDREDEEKLGVGIQLAVKKGVLPADSGVSPVKKINVVGKSADDVSQELLDSFDKRGDGKGKVIVLQGLSGTGKGTTVGKLSAVLPNCVCWSNGNVFRSVTYLVSEHCDATKTDFTEEVLTPELLSATMKRLSFDRFGEEFDVVIDGKTRVSTICNTLLKTPTISSRVPTVAGQTQGEVVLFAASAIKILQEAGRNVILEGRAQTLNYIPTPDRFELVIEDPALLGQRRAAQRVMAEAVAHAGEAQTDDQVLEAVKAAASKLAP